MVFGVALTILGTAYLAALVGAVVALVTAATAILYLFAYTPLKQRTALCTLVGAVPGALPPRAARSSGHDLGRRAHRRTSRRSEEHTSELQSRLHLVCRLLLEKKKNRR